MTGLDRQLLALPQMKTIQDALASHQTPVLAVGLAQIHKAGVIHALTQNRGAIVITQDEPTAVRLCEDIAAFFGSDDLVMHYPVRDFTFRELELKAHFPSCLWLVRNLEPVNLPPLWSF